jgi:hypothetical protein
MSSIAYGSRTAPVTPQIPVPQLRMQQLRAPRLRITPRGRAVLAALIAAPLVAVAWFGLAPAVQAGDTPASVAYTYVSVEPGQSLWQLAGQLAPYDDPREVIADILALNNLPSADVQPGQELAVPAQYAG